jgi:hypothetical protein
MWVRLLTSCFFCFRRMKFNVSVTRALDQYLLYLLLFLFIVIGAIDLGPFFFNQKFVYDEPTNQLHRAFHSSDYLTSTVLVIGLSIPLLLDIFIDLSYISLKFLIPRIILVTGCLITHLVFYISVISLPSSSLDSVTLFVGLYRTREYFIAGSLVTFLFQTSPSKYDKMISFLMLITGIAYNAVLTWYGLHQSPDLVPAIIVLKILLFGEFFGLSLWYLHLVCHERSETLTSSSKKLILIYLLLVSLFFVGVLIIWFSCGARTWDRTGATELISYNFLEACTMLTAIILPARLTRLETHAREVSPILLSLSLSLSVSQPTVSPSTLPRSS